jgi:hypothetical protein
MDNSEEYASIGEPWEKNEDDQLIREYNVDKLTILEISKIHKRMPGGILSRLKRLNLINMRKDARGYLVYQQSDLYKRIKKERIIENINKHENKKQILLTNNTTIVKNDTNDIIELKKDVKEIKETMNKILELMNAVYDFEIKEQKTKKQSELEEIARIWKNGSIEDKLNTYGIKNLIKLANYKKICMISNMDKAELVSILKTVTNIEDLPIR